jgi:pyruvate-formate lyase-activating enzyme
VLQDEAGRSVIAFLERRVDGAECLTQTARFNVSYYPAADLGDAAAARAVRALAAHIQIAEKALPESAIARVLSAGPGGRTLELRINRECNERCVFCNTPEGSETILPDAQSVLEMLEAERHGGYGAVLFTGREPTLDPRLVEYLRRARELGYPRLRLQTNGTRLSDRAYLAQLVEAGLSEVEISLHTRTPDTFLRLVGKQDLLARTLEGIHAVLDAGLRCHLVMVATTLNLAELPELLASLGRDYTGRLRHVTLSPMAPVGDGARALALVPRLTNITRSLPDIFAAAQAAGIHIDIPSRCGMPLCAIPEPYREHSGESANAPGLTLEAGKRKGTRCGECRFDAVCTGVWTAYLERHGDGELSPIRS